MCKGFIVEYDYNDVLKNSKLYSKSIGYYGEIKNGHVKYDKKGNQTDFMIDLIKLVYKHATESDLPLRC